MSRAYTVNNVRIRGNRYNGLTFSSLREMEAWTISIGNPIPYMTLYMRMHKLGWSVEQALRVKVNKFSRREVLQEERRVHAAPVEQEAQAA
jgi:hypothetical protein